MANLKRPRLGTQSWDSLPTQAVRRLLSIAPESAAKREDGAYAKVGVEYGPIPLTHHTIFLDTKWGAKREFGQVVKKGFYDEKIAVPHSLTIMVRVEPPNSDLLHLFFEKINDYIRSEKIQSVGPPRFSSVTCSVEVMTESPFGDDPDSCLVLVREILLRVADEVRDAEFKHSLDVICPPGPTRKGGIFKHSISGSEMLASLRYNSDPPPFVYTEPVWGKVRHNVAERVQPMADISHDYLKYIRVGDIRKETDPGDFVAVIRTMEVIAKSKNGDFMKQLDSLGLLNKETLSILQEAKSRGSQVDDLIVKLRKQLGT